MAHNLKTNKDKLIQHVLTPISRVTDNAALRVTDKGISCVCTSQTGGNVVLYVEFTDSTLLTEDHGFIIGLPDVKRFIRLLDCIENQNINIVVENNHLTYKDDSFKFKYFLLEESVLPKNTLSTDKIKKLTFDHEFTLSSARFSDLLKGSAITVDSDKLYLYTKDGIVYGELNDYERQNINNLTYKIATSYSGAEIATPIVLGLECVRLFSGSKTDSFQVKVNNVLKIVCFEYQWENVALKYIISSLVK
jgi:hypothetical protein